MLFLFNKNISEKKAIIYSLKKIYGINIYQSKKLCKIFGINPKTTINKLNKIQLNKLIKYINDNLKVENDLKKNVYNDIKKLITVKNNRGLRLSMGLPVNGQRTRTNAKNCKKYKKN